MVWIHRRQIWEVIPVAHLTESSHWTDLPVWTRLPDCPRTANRKELSQSLRDRWGNGNYKIRVYYRFSDLQMGKATKNFVRQCDLAAKAMKEFRNKAGKLVEEAKKRGDRNFLYETDYYQSC